MSTPRPNCKHENSAEHPADRDIKVCPECFKMSQDGGLTWAEGVAAPLEPSPQDFYENVFDESLFDEPELQACDDAKVDAIRRFSFKLAKAYAAAVSKNLQKELANEILIKDEWRDLCKRNEENCFKALDRIRELEKEIAALRETK